jgi:RNA polymerase sigma-70 factor (sigma-E family)
VKTDESGERSDAFARLFAAKRRSLLRFAYVLCGDGQVAEELVAEAWARMYPKWRRDRIVDPAAYARSVVANLWRGRLRHLRVQRSAETHVDAAARLSSSHDTAVADRDAMRVALDGLGPRQRAVIVLRFLEDRSEADTAAILGITVGTVKSQASKALATLRSTLAAEAVEGSLE